MRRSAILLLGLSLVASGIGLASAQELTLSAAVSLKEAVEEMGRGFAATRPGRRLRDILQAGIEAYVRGGYPEEWQRHHQGGPCGYASREYLATPTSDAVVWEGQFFAWNPTIAGFKAEDTIEIGPDGNEILTEIPGWPMLEVEVNGQVWRRPAAMEVRD